MSSRPWLHVLASAVLLAGLLASPVTAANFLPKAECAGGGYPPIWASHPGATSARPPGSRRFGACRAPGPYVADRFGVPRFAWGYFGARYRTGVDCHSGYYNTYRQWTFR